MTELKFQKVEMTDEELIEKKLHLKYCKINKDESDLNLKELEDTLDAGVPNMLMKDDIEKLEKDISSKEIKDPWGKDVPATEADIVRMNVILSKFKNQRDLDIPNRQLRLKINQIRQSKGRPDAPERQIKVLEKEIREKAYEHIARESPPSIN